MDDEVPL